MGGSSQKYQILRFHRASDTPSTGELSFDLLIRGTTPTDYETQLDAAIAAFDSRHVDTTLVLGARTLIDWSHTGHTGMESEAEISKSGAQGDTPCSSVRRVTIRVRKPFTQSGFAGRIAGDAVATVDGAEITTLTVSASYTGQPSANTAYAQAIANFATYAGTFQSLIGGTWEQVARPQIRISETAKALCSISAQYRQIIATQAMGVTDNAAIVDPILSISRDTIYPGDFFGLGNVDRFQPVRVSYSCKVARSSTTDLKGLYEGTIKPLLASLVQAIVGGGNVVLVRDSFTPQRYQNVISAQQEWMAQGGGNLLSVSFMRSVSIPSGLTDVAASGSERAAVWVLPTAARPIVQTTILVSRVIGGGGGGGATFGGGSLATGGGVTSGSGGGGNDPIEAIIGPAMGTQLLMMPANAEIGDYTGAGGWRMYKVGLDHALLSHRRIGNAPYDLTVADERLSETVRLFKDPPIGQPDISVLPTLNLGPTGSGGQTGPVP